MKIWSRLSGNDYELLSQTCHQLRELRLEYITFKGANLVLGANNNLEEIITSDDVVYDDWFGILGVI